MLALVVPALSSNPGAFQTLYLDFDGSNAFLWDNGDEYIVRGPGGSQSNPNPVPAFTTDGNPADFSNSELQDIERIFQWVSEKFSPFTINVTTVDPGIVQDGRNMTALIGGSCFDWLGDNAGGVADISGFRDGGENTFFAFTFEAAVVNGNSGTSLWRFVGETIAHEAGHAVGLFHQRTTGNPPGSIDPPDEYFNGDNTRSPIMGGSSNNGTARGIWWRTNNWPGQNSPDQLQDDLAALTFGAPEGLAYRSDDGDRNMTFSTTGQLIGISGLIGNTSDIDRFSFQATGSTANFTVLNYPYGGMLAPQIELRVKNTQALVPITRTTTNTNAALTTASLAAGVTYELHVFSQGGYGDIGRYSITGSQQTFAALDFSNGNLTVGGLPGNNHVFFATDVINNELRVYNSLNGGQATFQNFPLNAVHQVVIDLGSGNDTIDVGTGLIGFNLLPVDTFVYPGGGSDTLRIGGGSNFLNFNVEQWWINWTLAGGANRRVFNFESELVELNGTLTTDVFNFNDQNQASRFNVYGSDGTDRLTFGPGLFSVTRPVVKFFGGNDTDTLEFAMQSVGTNQSWNVWDDMVVHNVPGSQAETQYDSTVENVSIRGGNGNDALQVYSVNAGTTAHFDAGGGNDTLAVGYTDVFPQISLPFSSFVLGSVSIIGGAGNDHLYVDDANYGSVGIYDIWSSYISNTFVGNTIYYSADLEEVDFYACKGASTKIVSNLAGTTYRLYDPTIGPAGSLVLDDRSLQVAPFEIDVYGDRLISKFGLFGIFTSCNIYYSGYESVTLRTHNQNNSVRVYGTSPSVTGQTSIFTGTGADTVVVYPHGEPGATLRGENLTILTPLGYIGGAGADSFIIDNSQSTFPTSYLFDNVFGIGTASIHGVGPASIGSANDVETTTVLAGSADDTFTVDSFKSGTALYISAGDGNDSLDFGADNLPANITSATALSFDGQDGFDTFNFENTLNPDAFQYTNTNATVQVSRSFPFASYNLTVGQSGVEAMNVLAGANADGFSLNSVAPGQMLSLFAGDGNDILNFINDTTLIAGPVWFYGEAGSNNRITSLSNSDTAGQTLHITQNSIGAFPGDNFWGVGGALYFDAVASILLSTGGGPDAVFVRPNELAAITISGAGDGDMLNLALADFPDYVVTPGAPGGGDVTGSAFQTVSYSSFEAGPVVDDAAPTVVGSTFEVDLPQQALVVEFSEDVSASLVSGSIVLTNTTTSQTIDPADIAVSYDTGTNLATFTFPNFAYGVLPDGNYDLSIAPGALADAFGNALLTGHAFSFYFLNGDASRDGAVNSDDFNILATSFGLSGRVFSQGDFNYDGLVDSDDFNILATRFGTSLAPQANRFAQARILAGSIDRSDDLLPQLR